MGFFFTGYTIETVVMWLGLVGLLVLANEATRKNKWLGIGAYCVLPVVVGILIATGKLGSESAKTWFGWVKTISALAGVIGFMLIRYSKLGKTKFTYIFPMAILGINILEAIYRELEVYGAYPTQTIDPAGLVMLGGPWNIINAIAGVFLLLSLTGFMGIKVANTKSKDMVWADQLWFWIIAYDLWNISYCYNCISTRSMYAGVALIVACTLAEFCFKRGAWLQHRAQTLALFGMFSLAIEYSAFGSFGIQASYNPKAWLTMAILSLIANVAVFGYEMYRVYKYKRNPLKQDMYVELSAYKHNLEANNLLAE